jgi:hypothetical protein
MFLKKELTEYNRYQAFAVHMAISLVIFFIILACITQYWYPGILFETGNGWKAIGMIVGIDLILGPLLTLIVFNHKKSSLKFDLLVIALIQVAALSYGTWTIYKSHPIAITYFNKSFITLYADSTYADQVKEKVHMSSTLIFYYRFSEAQENNFNAEKLTPYSHNKSQILTELNASGAGRTEKDQDFILPLDQLLDYKGDLRLDAQSATILGYQPKNSNK